MCVCVCVCKMYKITIKRQDFVMGIIGMKNSLEISPPPQSALKHSHYYIIIVILIIKTS